MNVTKTKEIVTGYRKKSKKSSTDLWPSVDAVCAKTPQRVYFCSETLILKLMLLLWKNVLCWHLCVNCVPVLWIVCLYFFCDSKVTGNQRVAPVYLMVGLGMLRLNQVEAEGVQLWWVFLLNSFYFLVFLTADYLIFPPHLTIQMIIKE